MIKLVAYTKKEKKLLNKKEPIWQDNKLEKFLERTNWNLWEEIEEDTVPKWLKNAMEQSKVRGVISFSSQEGTCFYTFRGRHFIYRVEVSYLGFHIYRTPRDLEARLPTIIRNLKD